MRIDNIKMGGGLPSEVTVTMSIQQAAAIATVFGKMNGFAHRRLGLANEDEDFSIYDVLTGDLFNRFWDDGVNEYNRDRCLAANNAKLEDLNRSMEPRV